MEAVDKSATGSVNLFLGAGARGLVSDRSPSWVRLVALIADVFVVTPLIAERRPRLESSG
jgi:hypothetical protein